MESRDDCGGYHGFGWKIQDIVGECGFQRSSLTSPNRRLGRPHDKLAPLGMGEFIQSTAADRGMGRGLQVVVGRLLRDRVTMVHLAPGRVAGKAAPGGVERPQLFWWGNREHGPYATPAQVALPGGQLIRGPRQRPGEVTNGGLPPDWHVQGPSRDFAVSLRSTAAATG